MARRYKQLVQIFHNPEQRVRAKALATLRRLSGTKLLSALINTLKTDPDYSMRYFAIVVLTELGDKQAIPALCEALQDARLWGDAAVAISKFNEPELVQALVASLATHTNGMTYLVTRRRVIDVILQFGEPAIILLLKALNDPERRTNAVIALGEAKENRATEPIIKILQTSLDKEQREAVLYALGKIKTPNGFQAIEQVMNNPNDNESLRCLAAQILGQTGPSALPILLNALTSSSLRYGAIRGLAQISETEYLVKLLNDPNSQIRCGVLEALGLFDHNNPNLAPIEPIMHTLKDEDSQVRQQAIKTIYSIVFYISIDSNLQWAMPPEKIERIKRYCDNLDYQKLTEAFTVALNDEDELVSRLAASVLDRLKLKISC